MGVQKASGTEKKPNLYAARNGNAGTSENQETGEFMNESGAESV